MPSITTFGKSSEKQGKKEKNLAFLPVRTM